MSTFGPEYAESWPKCDENVLQLTDFGKTLLKRCAALQKPTCGSLAINDFMRKSADFPIRFGTNTCRVLSQPVERYPIIMEQIASAYPIIHERVLGLYLAFLEHKFRFGNDIELQVYQSLSLTDFVQRLLIKRCVCFTDPDDNYMLLTGQRGFSGSNNIFEKIGTPAEKKPFELKSLLSYDEIKLSAFLSVSSYTEFINEGHRDNYGRIQNDKSKMERDGVVIGLIGARFQRYGVMDTQDILITKAQNTKGNGYGMFGIDENANRLSDYRRVWSEFYQTPDVLYETALRAHMPRFLDIPTRPEGLVFFDNLVMKKRFAISMDTLLLETESRAAAAGKQAYVHVVGIGLGVWMFAPHQEVIFLETFTDRIKALLPQLKHIAVLNFSWFRYNEWGELKNNGIFHNSAHVNGVGIRTFISKRNPSEKLPNEYQDCLLVVSYAWDGNSMPGNEFWDNCLGNSSDSSNASSTLVTELHNPLINTQTVNGTNLHIATLNHGVMHIKDYCKNVLELF